MKCVIFTFIALLSLTAFAQDSDKSTRMDNLLKESGVQGWGKKHSREATIICKVPKKTNELECHLSSGGSNWSMDVYRKFKEEEAVTVSNLLKEFNQYPAGKRQRQEVEMDCETNKGTSIKVCEVLEPIEIWESN